jgi:hypothetical protein
MNHRVEEENWKMEEEVVDNNSEELEEVKLKGVAKEKN